VYGPQGVWTHHRPMLQHERKKMDCEENVKRNFLFKDNQEIVQFFLGGADMTKGVVRDTDLIYLLLCHPPRKKKGGRSIVKHMCMI